MTDRDVAIREVLAKDFPSWSRLYRAYRTFYNEPDDDARVATTWSFLLDPHNECKGLVAVVDDELVGLAVFREHTQPLETTPALHLDDLFVEPGARGRGVGERIIRELESIARERGCSVVRWVTADDNTAARRVYDRIARATQWVTYELDVD